VSPPPAAARGTILLLSGPNLGLLGSRLPEVYGTATLTDHVAAAVAEADRLGLAVDHLSSDSEGDLVTAVGRARGVADAVVVNAGALTHYSWALHDALAAFDGPVVELHLSNPQAREGWRRTSVVTPAATAVIAGLGGAGYRLAIVAVAGLLGLTADGPGATG